MSHASEAERAAVEAPREFVTAWLYVVMGMVYGSQDHSRWSSRTSRMRELLEQGMKKLMHSLPNKSLLERTSMMPLEVLSLVTFGLLQDQVGKSDDICETYSQYLNSLVRQDGKCNCSLLLMVIGKFDHVETVRQVLPASD